jgi:ion channel
METSRPNMATYVLILFSYSRGRATILKAVDNKRARFRSWQERARNPGLTVLLVVQVFLLFVALPLDAAGVPIAAPITWLLLLAPLTVVVTVSRRPVATAIMFAGYAAAVTGVAFDGQSPTAASLLNGGFILLFSALTWVVGNAVYAPGRITFHRLQGAVVIYLSAAMIFATAYRLIWELIPGAFSHLPSGTNIPYEFGTMLYFSITTLATVGYGDIVPIHPFARSLANFEAIAGQFYLAITVARLVTMEIEDRRSRTSQRGDGADG